MREETGHGDSSATSEVRRGRAGCEVLPRGRHNTGLQVTGEGRCLPKRRLALSRLAFRPSQLASGIAATSQYAGAVPEVRVVPSPSTLGNVRVAILTSGPTNCTGSGGAWYSYDDRRERRQAYAEPDS
jgi:hypothetical protein